MECYVVSWLSFLPVVLAVLGGFTLLLPGIISAYLVYHRKTLHTPRVLQRIGFLYDHLNRGAEFWEVHELWRKMILTGLIIYLPPTTQAAVATIVCLAASCNLNYFRPHKSSIVFWVEQTAFAGTAIKYLASVVLVAMENERLKGGMGQDEVYGMGIVLVSIDCAVMLVGVFGLLAAVVLLRRDVRRINREDASMKGGTKVIPKERPTVEATDRDTIEESVRNWQAP